MKLLALHSVDIVEARSPEQCRIDNEERKKTNPLVIATNNEKKLVLDILNNKLKLVPNLTSQGNFDYIDSKNGRWWYSDNDIDLSSAFSDDEPLPDIDTFGEAEPLRFVDPLLGLYDIADDYLIIQRKINTIKYNWNLQLFVKYRHNGWYITGNSFV